MKQTFLLFLIFFSIFFLSAASNAKASFNEGVFLRSEGPKVYFLENGMKRWVETAEIFNAFGFDWKQIRYVSKEELERHPTGSSIKSAARYPDGILLRQAGDYKVYITKRGYRQWIKDIETFNNMGLFWGDIFELPEEKIKKIREGSSIEKYTPTYRPQTVFLSVPDKNIFEVPETLTFKFSAITGSFFRGGVVFETFLQGYDRRWVRTARGERKIRMPKKSGDYIFYVRAKYKNGAADLTPELFKFKINISPIFENIVFSSVNVSSDDPNKEVISLTNKTNLIYNLSGWSIESQDFGTKYYILGARLIPSYPGYDYNVNVMLAPKDKVMIYSSKGPFNYGFKLNNCVGYLNSYYDFTPALPKYCKKLDNNKINRLSNYCQKTIKNATARCEEPNYNDLLLDNECRAFMRDKLNYPSCVSDNMAYYDFYKNEWRLYLGSTSEIWADNDTLLLRDPGGFVVDSYKY